MTEVMEIASPCFEDAPSIVSEIVAKVIPEVETIVINEIELPPPADAAKIDEIKLIHENTVSASSSYVIDTKGAKKVFQKPKIVSSASERPQTARERMRKPVEVKPDVKFAHKLGSIPKYLQKRKDQSSAASACSSMIKIDDCRPKTVDLSMIDLQRDSREVKFLMEPSKEIQGDVKSEKSQISLSARPAKIIKSKSKIAILTKDNENLKIECETLKSNFDEQQKTKSARIKSLEIQIARLQKDAKQNAEIIEKQLSSEIEIANLKKNVESLNGRLKIKDDVISRLKSDMEKLGNEVKIQTSSFETLTMEKTHLQTLLDGVKKGQKDEMKEQSSLVAEVVALNGQLKKKCDEISELNNKIENLSEEIESLKSKSNSSSRASINTEMMQLRDQIHILKKSEEKLTLEVHKFQSLLDDEKNANISNETLLGLRADYIKTLQETDDINKIRLVSQAQELLNHRKLAKEFEKFKAAHAEEKINFESMLNKLNEKNIKLTAENNLIQKRLDQKSYKYQKHLIGNN